MRNSTKYLVLPLILILAVTANQSCKKDEENSPPHGPKGVRINIPADSALVQLGTILSISAETYFFDSDPALLLIIDTLSLQKRETPPYEFLWDTKGWSLAAHTIRVYADVPHELIEDEITIFLIDTIPPQLPPVAMINISPAAGNTDSIYTFDASNSYDPDGLTEDLLYRWDFDGDDEWDTDYSDENTYHHIYTHPNNYQVRLEVMDSDSLIADTVQSLLVVHSGNQNACGGYVSIPLGGKIYHTLAIGNQCWLRENLNIGEMIADSTEPANNGIIEKYCYNNDSLNCEQYGGLYTWDEIMKYFPIPGARGICPTGWHIPTDDEWKELEGYTDTQYGIDDEIWDGTGFRGYDSGKHLKSLIGWVSGGAGDNLFAFKALPAGSWQPGIGYSGIHSEARFWCSTHDSGENAFERLLGATNDNISRDLTWDKAAFSVRCLKD